ncbi:MAG TPA: hypothetical protein VK611_09320 [Acidimicrobiales bacterium]|nr:hypothetical protein [Acidimicrobiales bacterium]
MTSGEGEEGVFEGTGLGSQFGEGDAVLGRHRADRGGGGAGDQEGVVVAVAGDGPPLLVEQLAEAVGCESSRSVSCSSAGRGSAGSGRARTKWSSRRRVTLAASRASPRATTRTPSTSSAGRTSLSMKPLAPARRAAKTYSSMS